ncbi:MAG: TolC family protein, partial [Lentisphaeraceae bacterium]|nr:TolC family protein [Lentisphaeraceae bacterium]
MNNIFRVIAGSIFCLVFVSCQSYKPMAIVPKDIFEELSENRKLPKNESEFTLMAAEKVMSQRNRSLRKLRLEYEKLQKIADIKTPFPNPSIEFGPSFGSHLEGAEASSTQPFVGLGFTIPLGPRLARNDDLNKAKELQAYNKIVIEHRKLYLELRKAF